MSTPSSDSPGPDPAVTAGLEPGSGVQPGDTPPAADSMSGTGGEVRDDQPNMGPVSGNRTPAVIALTAIAIIAVLSIGFIVASLVAS